MMQMVARQRRIIYLYSIDVLLTMIKHSTVQATFAAKAKQSHWAVMISTCSYEEVENLLSILRL
jgi:hypothetical protein